MEGRSALEKLNQAFEISEDAILETSKEISVIEGRILESDEHAEEDEIFSFKTLKEDFYFIKESIMQNVQIGKKLLDTLLEQQEDDIVLSEKTILAASDLIKANNSSLKQLSNIFKEIKEIERLRNHKDSPVLPEERPTQNIFVGNINDILKLKQN